ncbi:hypothetical protein V8C86DRAFT_2473189 [Haematococcus lacustris]
MECQGRWWSGLDGMWSMTCTMVWVDLVVTLCQAATLAEKMRRSWILIAYECCLQNLHQDYDAAMHLLFTLNMSSFLFPSIPVLIPSQQTRTACVDRVQCNCNGRAGWLVSLGRIRVSPVQS